MNDHLQMRAGTQALIQALQAIPWTDDPEAEHEHDLAPASDEQEDERTPGTATELDSDSNDDANGAGGLAMASSIHTIHRPVARKQRTKDAVPIPGQSSLGRRRLHKPKAERSIGEEYGEDESESEQEREDDLDSEDDFETEQVPIRPPSSSSAHSTPKVGLPTIAERIGREMAQQDKGKGKEKEGAPSAKDRVESLRARSGSVASRSGSMATVRVKRRARLADKLRDVFELPGITEVVAELPCWLLRSIREYHLSRTTTDLC
jgi:sterol 3beta-glucosyltransferase